MAAAFRSTEGETAGMLLNEGVFDWEDVAEMVARKDYRFGRNPSVAQEYVRHLKRVKAEWATMDDYCKNKFFNIPFTAKETVKNTENSNGETSALPVCLKYASEEASGFSPDQDLVLVENDFPYALAPGIRHMLVWSWNDMPIEKYRDFLEGHFPSSSHEIILFENPAGLKSVRGVAHVQVFIRHVEASRAA